MQEREAIEKLKQGDIQGFEALVNQYQTQAIRAAYLIVYDADQAEDIAVDAFIRVYQKIEHYHSDKPFAPWFYQIVINLARRAARRQARTIPLESTDEAEQQPSTNPAAAAEANELYEHLRQAVMRLSAAQRSVIVQRYFLGLSIQEIAQQAHAPIGTVKWRLHAAHRQLKKWLSPDEEKGEV